MTNINETATMDAEKISAAKADEILQEDADKTTAKTSETQPKDVMVKIRSMQASEEAGEDEMEFITEARLYHKANALYLLYEESEVSGVPGCKTRLRLRGGEVQMKRFGQGAENDAELRFEKGKRHAGFYETPFGPLEIEILTNNVSGEITEEGEGQLEIDYNISLKGLIQGRNRLNITLM